MNLIEKNKVYLIAEIGINHNGEMSIVKRLIDAAHSIGWNAVKFQKREPDVCVPEKQKNIIRDTPWGKMTYLEYRKKIEFGYDHYHEINNYCKSKDRNMDWTASVWDIESLNFLMEFKDIPFIKIPSAKINDNQLLEEASKTKKQLVISTGMSTLEEVDNAVNLILKNTIKPIIMHTNSSYPSPLNELNLSLIPFYANRYNCVIGYSGHEPNLEPTVIAVSLGAKIIERHVTIDKNLWGSDQKASLSIHGMDILYKRIEDYHEVIGQPIKKIFPSEIKAREKLRKN